MSLIYGLEPLFMILLYLIARLPEANAHVLPTMCVRCLVDLEEGPSTPSNSESTALVIPCHKTDLLAFFNVLKGAFKHFQPEQIFVVENGNSQSPPSSELQDFCRRIDPRIQYIWSPVASKNAAQYVGTLAAHAYDYIMTTDDDVVLPWNYRSPTEEITEENKAVCFPIGARVARQQSWAGADSLVVSWQDIEFKASGLIKTAENQLCGVLYPHGAASFWERTTFIDALRIHSLVFYGEDTQLGFALQRMGKKISIDASIILQTEVPASFLGPPLNYWQQRVRSWEMGRMSMLFKFISHFFRINGQRTITGFLAQKLLQFYALYSIACDLIRVPLFVIMGSRP
jgi:cellulose synthase/poly-beta-1,6-N-acetylglucosamine synthase-like glycosyltransferase